MLLTPELCCLSALFQLLQTNINGAFTTKMMDPKANKVPCTCQGQLEETFYLKTSKDMLLQRASKMVWVEIKWITWHCVPFIHGALNQQFGITSDCTCLKYAHHLKHYFPC